MMRAPELPNNEHDRETMRLGTLLTALLVLLAPGASRGQVPTPESSLGFRPGADFHLATWPQVVSYFKLVDESSDRVKVRVLGESTEGRPYLAAIISSPETVASLEKYQGLQAKLHDPRTIA